MIKKTSGGAGNDQLFAGNGQLEDVDPPGYAGMTYNTLSGGTGDDKLVSSIYDDDLLGGANNDTLMGGDGADYLFGDTGNDLLEGSLGDDLLDGDSGDDVLVGGTGNDRIWGGLGADTFRFSSGDGTDRIDFYNGYEERIEVDGADSFNVNVVYDSIDGAFDITLSFRNGGRSFQTSCLRTPRSVTSMPSAKASTSSDP